MESVAHIGGECLEQAETNFPELVGRFMRKIYFLSLDLTGNHHDAEDLAQEAFLRAHKAMKKFRGEAQIGTWLYRITINTHIDRQRGLKSAALRTQKSLDDEEGPTFAPTDSRPGSDPEKQAESEMIQSHIDQALNTLSARQRTIFVLRHYQGLKLREIAALIDRSEGTVKTTLFRAVQRLQQELAFYRPGQELKEMR